MGLFTAKFESRSERIFGSPHVLGAIYFDVSVSQATILFTCGVNTTAVGNEKGHAVAIPRNHCCKNSSLRPRVTRSTAPEIMTT